MHSDIIFQRRVCYFLDWSMDLDPESIMTWMSDYALKIFLESSTCLPPADYPPFQLVDITLSVFFGVAFQNATHIEETLTPLNNPSTRIRFPQYFLKPQHLRPAMESFAHGVMTIQEVGPGFAPCCRMMQPFAYATRKMQSLLGRICRCSGRILMPSIVGYSTYAIICRTRFHSKTWLRHLTTR